MGETHSFFSNMDAMSICSNCCQLALLAIMYGEWDLSFLFMASLNPPVQSPVTT
ncbi:hypothetical protein Poly51_20440 [Rubripirellula tenax]|uniref:Uncharacterized protein n=1 Tax=Rubripirellula tenax TaxID=2528015 RepID=A0A5C6FCS1_9BACT|nr:hypothetical protein Poly51_20440 [Rubripirellula tenax]